MNNASGHIKLPEPVSTALQELKEALVDLFGERMRGLYLYGSYARGDFCEHSDVDVLVVLEGQVNPSKETDRLSATLSDICLRHDLLIAVYPVPAEWLVERKSPLFENIRREGVIL
jgi:predicted nucleotidyltransferase